MRFTRVLAVLALASTFVIGGVQPASAATEGSLDTTFDGDGKVVTALSAGDDVAYAVVVQPDGKIVTAGVVSPGQFALVRYKTDGSLDTSFDGDGKVATSIGVGSLASAHAVALQADGKIVAAGTAYDGAKYVFALARYNANGSLDTTFDGDGKLTTAMGTGGSGAAGVVVQGNGRIVAVGYANNGVRNDFAVARYNANGSLDTTFSADGKLTTSIGTGSYAWAVALQSDGKIVAAGWAVIGATAEFALARYTTAGVPDNTFDLDGVLTTAFGTPAYAHGVVVQANGKIVAAGDAVGAALNPDFAVARYNPNGALDTTFSGDGKVLTDFGSIDGATSLALQRDGKIVTAGYSSGISEVFALARYTTSGSLDTTFDGDGKVTTAIGTSYDRANAVAIQRNGKIVVAGQTAQSALYYFAVARYLGDVVPPTAGAMLDVPRYTTVVTRRFHWRAVDANVGVKSYDVRGRRGVYTGSTFTPYGPWKVAYPSNTAVFTGLPGRTYCFSVRARDWAGNLGPYGRESCMAVPVNDRTLAVSGRWTNVSSSAYYLGTARRSTSYGATLRLGNVHFRHLALIATTGPTSGTVRVYLGNTLLNTVNLMRSTTHHRVKLPIATSARVRSGTLRIVQVSGGRPVVIEGVGISLA